MNLNKIILCLTLSTSCAPFSGPDKSAAGAILGGGLGAGSGAIIGNQVGMPGAGVAIGAGMAAASGLASGIGLDLEEGSQLKAHRKLDNLKNQNSQNRTRLAQLENEDYNRSNNAEQSPAFLQVFFDQNRASLKLASANQIQHLASILRAKRYGTYKVQIKGYSTESNVPENNREIVDARVESVKGALVSNGIPEEYIKDISYLNYKKSPADFDREVEKGLLLTDRSEPNNRYNNRVEIFVKY